MLLRNVGEECWGEIREKQTIRMLDPQTDKTAAVPKYNEISPRLEMLRPNELLSGILQKKFNHYVGELTDIYNPYLSCESIKCTVKQAQIVVGLACFTSTLLS